MADKILCRHPYPLLNSSKASQRDNADFEGSILV